jgi:amino acid adenylation domain-containing protein
MGSITFTARQEIPLKIKTTSAWLIEKISKKLGVKPKDVDPDAPFSKLGIKSMDLVSIVAQMREYLNREIPSTLGFDYPNVRLLTNYIENGHVEENTNVAIESLSSRPECTKDVSESHIRQGLEASIAVIGMACRFPGGCNSPEEFHRFLMDGGDAISKVPADRWDADALFDPDPQAPGKMVTPWGGFVDSVDHFDAPFFGISPREARSMDPQQRLAMEISWEALEYAGEASERLSGGNTGVFIGISGSDYGRRLFNDQTRLDLYSGTGSAASIAANRISYFLGLRGPSIAVDTACSSSLVALDLACSSLKNGVCDMALAGGVNLILSPEMTIIFSKAGLMAPDGRCKTFDASADGYVRSEGCGIIVLKRYADAVRDGNRILALIRSSLVNQDGQSNGLTVPNGLAQTSLIRDALLQAGVTPSDVSYVEAHGTGTAIGDPIELNSLGAILGQGRSSVHPLIVGSVKSNIGHLEQAAGIAGVIKVIQSLVHETIPPNLHYKKPNPLIVLDDIPAIIPTQPIAWPSSNKSPRIAGVSGFSFGGVNAHIVFQEAPRTVGGTKVPRVEKGDDRPIHLMTLSATDEAALRDMADAYGRYLEDTAGLEMESVCRTSQAGRFHFSHRLAFLGRSVEEIAKHLRDYAANPVGSDIMQNPHRSASPPEVVFLFTGQGAQYPGMGRALYNSQPVFKETLDQCTDILADHMDRSLLTIVFGEDSSLLNETTYTQPALFALEYSLARMWQAWGIRPAAVMGHSVGEYTAACLAGVFGLEDGLELIAARGRLIQALPRNGKMAAVFAGVDQVSEFLPAGKDGMVSIAAMNGPENVVISGMAGSVDQVLNGLAQEGIQALPLTVSHAFHSPLMDPMLDAFEKIAAKVSFSVPDIAFVSNLTGEMAHEEVCEFAYWRKHIRHPVRFEESIRFLLKNGYHLMLEIGPQPILSGMAKSFLTDEEITCLPSLQRNEHDWRTISETLGNLYTQGARIDWKEFHRYTAGRLVPLPTYPFQRRRYWYNETGAPGTKHDTAYSTEPVHSSAGGLFHPLLKNHPHDDDHSFYEGLLSPSANDIILDQSVTAKSSDILAKISLANPEARQKIIEDHIRNHVAEVLWLPRDGQADVRRPLMELGLDSLMALELRKRLRRDFEIELAMTEFLRDASVSGLAVKVLGRLESSGTEKPAPDMPELPQIVPAPELRALPFPLTDVQHAYWIGRSGKFDLGGVSCHVYPEVEIADLDIEKLENAVNRLVKRHEMLRAVILPDGRQKILPEISPYRIEVQDLRGKTSDEVKKGLKEYRDRMSQQILPSETGPLFEIRASLLDGGMTRLHISFDLLIGDGWSFNILIRDLYEYYLDPGADLPPLALSFRDYVLAEQAIKGSELYQASLNYWRQRNTDLPPAPALPLAKSPSRIENHRFVRLKSRLDKEAWTRLKKRAAKAGLTPSGVLLAAFSEVLAAWSKDPRFTINLTMFNRLPLHSDVMDIVGDFTTLTLLAVDNGKGSNFEERAGNIQEQLWQDLEHRFVSGIEVLRQMTKEKRSTAGFPVVFTSLLPYSAVNDDNTAIGLPGDLAAELKYCISQTPQVWLDHQIFDQDGALVYNWDAVDGLFPEGVLEDMFETYAICLRHLAEDRGEWEKKRPHLMPATQRKRRVRYNETDAPVSSEMLHTLFLSKAAKQPDHPAVITSSMTLGYRVLRRRASGIACLLLEKGAGPGHLVGVVMEKGWEQVVAVTGVLMAGAAYLPLDSDLPAERLRYLLKEGEAALVLTQSRIADRIAWPVGTEVIPADMVAESADPPAPAGSPDDLAYVIYTSGSTGLPKGVMIRHRGAVNTVLDVNRRFGVDSGDRVLALSSLSFDLSIYDIFGTLAAGGTIVMPDAAGVRDPDHWSDLMVRQGVTLWNSAPALMRMLTEYGTGRTGTVIPHSLRLILLSGDRIPPDLPDRIRELAPDVEMVSLGGATEASIWSILHPIKEVDSKRTRIPYGRPMDNQRFYVLNRFWEDCPDRVAGDLYIGGIGLAEGYWKDSQKTAAAFVTHPVTGERLYRTGDIGCFLTDGNIEIMGREDDQVKIRGHRVELGEIEATLKQYPGVRDAIVAAKEDQHGERKLAGYIVPAAPGDREENQDRDLSGDFGLIGSDGAVLADPVERLEFKMKKPALRRDIGGRVVELLKPDRDTMIRLLSGRLSYRKFEKTPISLERFSGFLRPLLGGEFQEVPFPRYQFGSAGGIYPVQTYVYAKAGRIEALSEGVYYYHPLRHRLEAVSEEPNIRKMVFPPGNDSIFEEAGFAIFFIADMDAVRPLYGSRSREFCLIESGLMTHVLESTCFGYQIGLCQIGALDFDSVRHLFGLRESHEYLHCLLGGKIRQASGWTFLEEAGQAMPTLSGKTAVTSVGISRFLKQKLPGYMVPSSILFLKKLPLSANGKVDRNALPDPVALGAGIPTDYVAPETALQKTFADLFNQVLRTGRVSLHDNFIELGGDSLTAVRLTTRIREKFGVEFPLSALFEAADLADLANRIKSLTDIDLVALEEGQSQNSGTQDHEIRPAPDCRYDPFPLTDIQQAYWIGRSNAFELGNVATHFYIELESEQMDLGRLNHAWRQLIERHDMLRAVILPDGTQQVMECVPPYEFERRDLRGETEPDKYLIEVRDEMSHQVIPAGTWPLFDIRATHLTDRRIRLHFSMDALISDAWSVFSIFNEWYRLLRNPDLRPEQLEISFRDYVMAEQNMSDSSQYHRDREYWLGRLGDLPRAPELPLAVRPDAVTQPVFRRRAAVLSAELWGKLKQRAKTYRLTPSGLLITAYAEVLRFWSKNPRMTLNVTLFNRSPLHPQVNEIVGDFTSLIPLAVSDVLSENFLTRARKTQEQLWRDLDHRNFGGLEVMREFARQQGTPRKAVFPVVFTSALSMDTFMDASAISRLGDIVFGISQTPQVWLDHQVMEQDGALVFNWDAVEELFPERLLDDMFAAYCDFLQRLAMEEEAWQKTGRSLIPAVQLEKRVEANATEAPVSSEMLHTLFWHQVSRRPNHPAVKCSNRTLSYAELSNYSNRIGRLLREKGAEPNRLVAVSMQKGWEQVAAVLGILNSGAAYLPIDPELPKERIWHLLADGEIDLLLTLSWLDETLQWPEDIRRICVDKIALVDKDMPPLEPVQGPDDLAYVIYTSGSTGFPKGVMIPHRGAVNTVLDINRRFEFGPEDKTLAISKLNFDLSVYDIFGTLAAGGTIVLPDPDKAREPGHWLDLMKNDRITVWNSVPTLMKMLVEYLSGGTGAVPQSLRLVLLSGDWIPVDLPDKIKRSFSEALVISLGGATEASIWSNLYPIEEVDPDWKSIPYGYPMLNQRYHVLNEFMEDCPDWVPGQLYIGGLGLAKGYWRDEEKTTNRFIICPKKGERLYRTGDLGRYLPNGSIEFLGREDFQVKINGYRIECGEIEAALKHLPGVNEAVVIPKDGIGKEKQLVSYVAPNDERESVLFVLKQADPERCASLWESVGKAGLKQASQIPDSIKIKTVPAFINSVEELSSAIMRQVLHDMGMFSSQGEEYAIDKLMHRYRIQPRFQTLLRHWLDVLEEKGVLEKTEAGSYLNCQPFNEEKDHNASKLSKELTKLYSSLQQYIPLYIDLLKGNIDPLELLLTEDTFLTAERLERITPGRKYYLNLAGSIFSAIIDSIPSNKQVRVLELGTRAGILTETLLLRLPKDRGRYLYTDESTVFTDKIKKKMGDIPSLELGLLDMNKAPGAQGYEPHTFDVIIADKTLHRARHLEKTLKYVRKLLAPGGLLLLLEPTQNNRLMLITVGFFEDGFAHFEDERKTRQLPLIPVDKWHGLLEKTGFSKIMAFPEDGHAAGAFGQHIIVAQAPETVRIFEPSKIGAALRQKLPDYMVPVRYTLLDELPLSANMKVDRKALEKIGQKTKPVSEKTYVAPFSEIQINIARILKETLGNARVGIHENFFELGGDSLRAIQCINLLKAEYPVELSLQEFFEEANVDRLGRKIEEKLEMEKNLYVEGGKI